MFGASGGVGRALCEALAHREDVAVVHAGARNVESVERRPGVEPFAFDLKQEGSIEAAAERIGEHGPLDLVIVATGVLQTDEYGPEKSWSAIDPVAMADVFAINTIGPAVIGKHFIPLLRREGSPVFAALAARVGSIGDNGLGGWHSYRASKAALVMIVRNFALELGRRNKGAIAVTLHPGTVDTALSEPFQSSVPDGKLFTPAYSAERLLSVIDGLEGKDSGHQFAWDGERIPY